MKIVSKLLLLILATLIISCETTKNYEVQSTVPDVGGDGTIRFESGSYISGNFKGNTCYDCDYYSAEMKRIYYGDVKLINNSWGLIEGDKYTTNYNSNGSLYKIEFTYSRTSKNGVVPPMKVTFNNKLYEIYAYYFDDVPDLISSSMPIGLTHDEALNECKTLGFEDGSDGLLSCVVELSHWKNQYLHW